MRRMVIRGIQVLLVIGLLLAAAALRPVTAGSEPDVGFEPEVPTFVGCVARAERSMSGVLSVGSVVRGDVDFTRVPSIGEDSVTLPIDAAGGAMVTLDDVAAAGDIGVLTEMPTADAGAAVVLSGDAGLAGGACTPASSESLIIVGGSTMTGEQLDLVVTNPYAVDAVVSVGSSSENGEDSASEIASVLIPAGGTVTRDLSALLPLRQSLSVRVAATRGAVHAALLQSASDDVALSEGVAPAQDWWIPALAVRDSTSRLVIATDSPLPVNVQIDTYRAGTLTEAAFEGTIQPRSQADVAVSELGGAPVGLRVSSDGPVVVGLTVDGEQTRAVSPATTLSAEWMLPGTGSVASARAWILNAGEVAAELVLQPLAAGQPARAATIPPGAAVSVPVDPAGAGTLLRSSSEVAVLWSSRSDVGFALTTGTPTSVLAE